MILVKTKDKLLLSAPYDQRELVKAIGNYRWNRIRGAWEFPHSSVVAIIDLLNVDTTDEVRSLYQEYKTIEQNRQNKITYVQNLYTQNWDNRYPGLFRHQKIALEAAKQFSSYCLFMDTGTGKTRVAIELIKYRKVPALVVAPLSILEAVWVEEIEKFAPELKVINLWDHLELIKHKAAIYVINYEQFKKLDAIKCYIQFLIIDESSKLKDPSTQISKAVLNYKEIPYRLVLSGTPAPNSTLEFWAQVCFINSRLLGDNFYRFRNTYFTSYGFGNYQWNITVENREKIMNKIKEQAIFFSKSDALVDLPDQIIEKRYLEMDMEQRKVYQAMFNENIAYFEDKITISSTELTKLMKLREITSGFFFDDKGKAITISKKKIEILMEVLEEIGNHQVTIFCNFKWEIAVLKEKLGDKAVILSGEIKQRDKDKNIEMFKDNVVQYLIANVKSSAHGLNLQNCHYAIYFSLSYSHEDHKQSQDRFHRQGQKHNVTYFYPLMKQTIDEVLYKVLVRKANLLNSCMEMLKI